VSDFKYELEVLSPLHVGSGDLITPLEYVVVDDKFYRVDMSAVFRDEEFNVEAFMEAVGRDEERLRFSDFSSPELGKRYERYALALSAATGKDLESRAGDVREFIKTKERPYVPGSSIKGAIRTAMLWNALKEDPGKLRALKNHLRRLMRQDKVNKKKVGEYIEKLVFGKEPHCEVLRALQVSDTEAASIGRLEVYEVRTLTTTPNGHRWKGFYTFVEALKPGSRLTLRLKLDDFLMRREVASVLEIEDKLWMLEKIPQACNMLAKYTIDGELWFFRKYARELAGVLRFYEDLRSKVEALLSSSGDERSFLFHLAWGVGWHGMTVGSLLKDDAVFFLNLRKAFELGEIRLCGNCGGKIRGNYCRRCRKKLSPREVRKIYVPEFPKTRRIVFEGGKARYPLGWVELRVRDG